MGERNLELVYATERIPAGPSVFLAGPTPRSQDVPSWRPQARASLHMRWDGPEPLVVFVPEPRSGLWTQSYDDQFEWEMAAREAAGVIVYWINRDLKIMPGFTTNVEFGYDVALGRQVVLGCPPFCTNPERNRYLIKLADRHDVPVCETLAETMGMALHLLGP